MSSDSELDEFYDAEEVTPHKNERSKLQENSLQRVNESGGDDLEALERLLLERKKAADERRRQEDEDLQKRLVELEKRKKEEAERKLMKQEAEKRAIENEKRRKKLQGLRDMMADESTPGTTPHKPPPPKPPRTYLDKINSAHKEGAVDKINNDSKIDNVNKESSERGGGEFKGEENEPGQRSNSEVKGHAGGDSPVENNSDSSGVGGNVMNVVDESIEENVEIETRENEQVNLVNENVNLNQPDLEKLQSKNIPELITDDREKSKEVVDENEKSSGPEPDIVQSTKNKQNEKKPPPPPRPVAPPRRRKKTKAPEQGGEEGSRPVSMENPDMLSPEAPQGAVGLPASKSSSDFTIPTPTTTVMSLTKDLEQSLDLQSATSGDCLVHTVDEEKTKVVADDNAVAKEKDGEADDEDGIPAKPRPRSNSGRFLTDKEILDSVTVLNLDTGEMIYLSEAEEKLPGGVNPLSLHIMRRTKEYSRSGSLDDYYQSKKRSGPYSMGDLHSHVNDAFRRYSSDSSLHKEQQSDDEEHKTLPADATMTAQRVQAMKNKGIRIKRLIGKTVGKTVNKVKKVADEVLHSDESSSEDDELVDGRKLFKLKASRHHKGPYDFDQIKQVQDLSGEHVGAVWTMKFSCCGRLLATGGQDNVLRIWVLKEQYAYFDDMRQKYSEATKVSPAQSHDSLNSQQETNSETTSLSDQGAVGGEEEEEEDKHAPFRRKPFCVYRGHSADLLDVSWSKNYFILSSSMDKTVRLWHISRKECLCCFQHIDFVTAIVFHPRDDRYFLSGSLDGKLRLWNIPDKKVALWNEITGQTRLITAANFCQNGKFAVVGTYDGRCIFYNTEQLKYYTQIHVRSTRGKNAKGRKITGIEPLPGEDKILVTSNDSRLRLYDLRDLTLTCKYKGCANNSSQIKASFSSNGKFIVCGSEDRFVYVWKSQHEYYKFSSARRDRNDYWEGIKAHTAVVTAAVFSPNPMLVIKSRGHDHNALSEGGAEKKEKVKENIGEVFTSADFNGTIKVFTNKFRPHT